MKFSFQVNVGKFWLLESQEDKHWVSLPGNMFVCLFVDQSIQRGSVRARPDDRFLADAIRHAQVQHPACAAHGIWGI